MAKMEKGAMLQIFNCTNLIEAESLGALHTHTHTLSSLVKENSEVSLPCLLNNNRVGVTAHLLDDV